MDFKLNREAMYDLNEIIIFTKVAELKSFTKAASNLGIPVSTISKKIADLERRLGVSLIQRSTRKLSLPPHAQQFYLECQQHLQNIEEAQSRLTQSQQELRGRLKITVPISFGRGSFIDFLAHFQKENPDLSIELVVTNQFLDLINENIDVAIRFGNLKNSSLIARKIGSSRRILVATEKYIKENSPIKTPKDLERHKCILFKATSNEENQWKLAHKEQRIQVNVKGFSSGNDFNTIHELTLRDLGIGLIPEVYARPSIESGKLKQILSSWHSMPSPIYAVFQNRKLSPKKLQAFLSALSKWSSPHWG